LTADYADGTDQSILQKATENTENMDAGWEACATAARARRPRRHLRAKRKMEELPATFAGLAALRETSISASAKSA
jgi:hypothetical protein